MAILPIVTDPHPTLRRKAQAVRKVNAGIRQLLDDMLETMREAPGLGLAAPQVGVSKRLIVVDPGAEQGGLHMVINPEITRHGTEVQTRPEGCLSIPGWIGDVERWLEIEVKGLDRQGRPVFITASDMLARVFQHEIDHLDGILFTDKCTNLREYPKPAESEAAGTGPAETGPETAAAPSVATGAALEVQPE